MSAVRLPTLLNVQNPTFSSRVLQYAGNVLSNPLDACVGAMWTGYVVMSVKELSEYALAKDDREFTFSFADREVTHHDFLGCVSFAVANVFKFIDWFGQSSFIGATKVAFPHLSAAADLFYVFSYAFWLLKSVKNISESEKNVELKNLDYSSRMFQQGKELATIADFAANLSYLTFSALSFAAFVTGASCLSVAISTSLVSYFVFLGLRSIGDEAVNAFAAKARQFFWINSNPNLNRQIFV